MWEKEEKIKLTELENIENEMKELRKQMKKLKEKKLEVNNEIIGIRNMMVITKK